MQTHKYCYFLNINHTPKYFQFCNHLNILKEHFIQLNLNLSIHSQYFLFIFLPFYKYDLFIQIIHLNKI